MSTPQSNVRRWLTVLVLSSLMFTSISPVATAQIGQPDIIQEHWYHSYATLTLDLNEWAEDHPDVVKLFSIGLTELGREIWMLQISDWEGGACLSSELDECEHFKETGEGELYSKRIIY